MDLIYMNHAKEDIGVMKGFTFDLAFGADENDFECELNLNRHCCNAGDYLYIENTEYGGIIDSIAVDTDQQTVTYIGRTWHGILDSKVLQPDARQSYLTLQGEANTVLATLISRMHLEGLFRASTASSGISINSYKMNRYITGYKGIMKMLKASGAKLNVAFKEGFVELSARPSVNYASDEEFDADQISFKIQQDFAPINHVVCLGKGELAEREIIHVYADRNGNVSSTQVITGIDEVAAVYDYSSAESTDELRQGGVDIIKESWASSSVEWDFSSNEETYDIGDIVGAKERLTGIEAASEITKKIVTINETETNISYKVGD